MNTTSTSTKRQKNKRKFQTEVQELKNTKTVLEKKNTVEGLKSRLDEAEGKNGILEYRSVDITQKEQQKEGKNLRQFKYGTI